MIEGKLKGPSRSMISNSACRIAAPTESGEGQQSYSQQDAGGWFWDVDQVDVAQAAAAG